MFKRLETLHRICNEINNNASSIAKCIHNASNVSYREMHKAAFFSLVDENIKLSRQEKKYCKNLYVYEFELNNVAYKWGTPKRCLNCKLTRYSEKYCENCISLHLQKIFDAWTSGNEIIDNFIQECQKLSPLPNYIMEWIPFHQFENVRYLTKGGFGSIYIATWKRGYITDYDENEKAFTYFGPQYVALKVLKGSNNPGKFFFDEVSIRVKMVLDAFPHTYLLTWLK